jgi:predicted enzyme related to lactoylglutathione lyase
MKFSGVLIGSEDPARLKQFYTKLFGTPAWEDEKYFGWRFGDATVMFGPHDQVKGKNREPGRIIWNFETPDVKGEFAKLKAAGATVVKEPYDPGENSGMLIGTFSDPDGNYFQLGSPMDEAAMEEMQRQATARR